MCRTKRQCVSCVTCGVPVKQAHGKGRARLYCDSCRSARAKAACISQGKLATCVECGRRWTSKVTSGRHPLHCSAECRRSAIARRRAKTVKCSRCNSTFVSKTGKGRFCPQCRRWRPSQGEQVECLQCGRSFYRQPSCSQMYCSRKCLHDALRTWHTCKHCAKVFSRRKYRASDKREYCCMQCYWDAHGMDGSVSRALAGRHTGNTRKRCRKAGVPYDSSITINKVSERDAYQCQLCGKQCNPAWLVNKRTRTPHPRNRTIDHIVPIAAGVHGHEWHNVQCACLACNMKKGASRIASQLRLL
jgi:hypothetical protein